MENNTRANESNRREIKRDVKREGKPESKKRSNGDERTGHIVALVFGSFLSVTHKQNKTNIVKQKTSSPVSDVIDLVLDET